MGLFSEIERKTIERKRDIIETGTLRQIVDALETSLNLYSLKKVLILICYTRGLAFDYIVAPDPNNYKKVKCIFRCKDLALDNFRMSEADVDIRYEEELKDRFSVMYHIPDEVIDGIIGMTTLYAD